MAFILVDIFKIPANIWSNQSIARTKMGKYERKNWDINASSEWVSENDRRSIANIHANNKYEGRIKFMFYIIFNFFFFRFHFVPFAGTNLSSDAKHLMDFHFNYFHSVSIVDSYATHADRILKQEAKKADEKKSKSNCQSSLFQLHCSHFSFHTFFRCRWFCVTFASFIVPFTFIHIS